jgi:hypothetical protein
VCFSTLRQFETLYKSSEQIYTSSQSCKDLFEHPVLNRFAIRGENVFWILQTEPPVVTLYSREHKVLILLCKLSSQTIEKKSWRIMYGLLYWILTRNNFTLSTTVAWSNLGLLNLFSLIKSVSSSEEEFSYTEYLFSCPSMQHIHFLNSIKTCFGLTRPQRQHNYFNK